MAEDMMRKAITMFPMVVPVVLFHAFVQNTGDLAEAATLAFLMGAVFQLVVAAALFGGAVFIYSRKLNPVIKEKTKRKLLWRVITYVLILLGIFFTLGSILSFANYLAALEIVEGSVLI